MSTHFKVVVWKVFQPLTFTDVTYLVSEFAGAVVDKGRQFDTSTSAVHTATGVRLAHTRKTVFAMVSDKRDVFRRYGGALTLTPSSGFVVKYRTIIEADIRVALPEFAVDSRVSIRAHALVCGANHVAG